MRSPSSQRLVDNQARVDHGAGALPANMKIVRFFMIFFDSWCRDPPAVQVSASLRREPCAWMEGKMVSKWSAIDVSSEVGCQTLLGDELWWCNVSERQSFHPKTLAMTVARGRRGQIMSYHDHLLHFCVLHSMSMIDIAWRYRYDMSAGKHEWFIRTQYSSAAQVFHTGSHTGGSNSPNNFLEKADQCETSEAFDLNAISKGSKDMFFLMSCPWYLGSKLQNVLNTMCVAPVALGGQSPARAGSCFTRPWWFLSWTMKSREGDLRGKAAFQENKTFQWLKEFVNVHSLPPSFLGKLCPDFQMCWNPQFLCLISRSVTVDQHRCWWSLMTFDDIWWFAMLWRFYVTLNHK